MDHLEALADAIMQYEGWKVGFRSWRNRNPGNLRPFEPGQTADPAGYRIFPSLDQGWAALRADLTAKFNGSHGLTPQSTLLDLLNVYAPAGDQNNPTDYCVFVCKWVSQILAEEILPSTTLYAFVSGE